VVELAATPAASAHLPLTLDAWRLDIVDPGPLTSIAPFAGQQAAVSRVLKSAYGLEFPQPNETVTTGAVRAIWFGRDLALLAGAAPDGTLARHAALTDQSDAWAAFALTGAGMEDVLARLVPLDLRRKAFGDNRTCRTLLAHMNVSITRTGADSLMILVFRSMAQTLIEEVQEAMEAVAARG
jgi:heterotetrameric sarcosine oxidase gamma subunit